MPASPIQKKDDCYLTNGSPEFHKKLGYHTVGRFSKCGCKFGKWYDMIWMEKLIGEHPDNPSAIIPLQSSKKSVP